MPGDLVRALSVEAFPKPASYRLCSWFSARKTCMANQETRRVVPTRHDDSPQATGGLTNAGPTALEPPPDWWQQWPARRSYMLVALATILCLVPFSGKAFHVDDTLFLFAAQQIVKHPLDPYGFQLVWNTTLERMADITKNPPLACYYGAGVGRLAGWSERAFHIAFLVPSIGLVIGTCHLARKFTRTPLVAAACTLLTPGVLVPSTSIMCDVMMEALWVWAAVFWVEGLELRKPILLLTSSILVAACSLTKYFGLALIPLLFVYSLLRTRSVGRWALCLVIPVPILIGYQLWTAHLYGHNLILDAGGFALHQREQQQGSTLGKALVGLSFLGGCTLPALTLVPLLWSRRHALIGGALSGLASLALAWNWVDFGVRAAGAEAYRAQQAHWAPLALQLTLCVSSGISVLALAFIDVWKRRDASSTLLALWVVGTFLFAGFLNWTVNARSVLPLIPAAGILIARRLERVPCLMSWQVVPSLVVGLVLSGAVSLWATASDAALANVARQAAVRIRDSMKPEIGRIWFEGHWGFQYYMQSFGFAPADERHSEFRVGDWIILPENNVETIGVPPGFPDTWVIRTLDFETHYHVTTISWQLGAGFYSSYWGPLPFAIGRVAPERYWVLMLESREAH